MIGNKKLLMAGLLGLLLVPLIAGPPACGYDPYVYDNLNKSRDALLSQRAELKRAYDDVSIQADQLNAKLTRLDSYIRQVDSSIKDVDDALKGMH